MTVRERVPLKELTTLRAGGPARFVASCETDDHVRTALEFAKEQNLPTYVLGEGSNVLAADTGYDGVIVQPVMRGIEYRKDGLVVIGAGVSWDTFVKDAASRGLWGIENLAGIPGSVGAAPVQNIGAYGAEVASGIAYVEAIRKDTGELVRLSNEECAFGYRDSCFKRDANLVIVRVAFHLRTSGAPDLSYADVAKVKDAGADLSTPETVGEAVRAIRAKKFPDLALHGTAGSFFKNPIVTEEVYARLAEEHTGLPRYAADEGVKIPLAFILDRVLNLRGYRKGNAWLYDAQPLVLVLDEGGSAEEVDALAEDVAARVFAATDIHIEREVRCM